MVYVSVLWEMHFTYLHVAVLKVSCSGVCSVGAVLVFSYGWTRLFTYILVGTASTFSYGETGLFTYIRDCRC